MEENEYSIRTKVRDAVARLAGIPPDKIDDNTEIAFGWRQYLVQEIGIEFRISVHSSGFVTCANVGELIATVQAKKLGTSISA